MGGGAFARPALMEMGGKTPTIVTASADPEAAAEGVGRAAFGLSGQKCSACSRAIAVGDAAGPFTAALGRWADGLAVGDPVDSLVR